LQGGKTVSLNVFLRKDSREIRQSSSGTAAETNNMHPTLFDDFSYTAMLSGGENTH